MDPGSAPVKLVNSTVAPDAAFKENVFVTTEGKYPDPMRSVPDPPSALRVPKVYVDKLSTPPLSMLMDRLVVVTLAFRLTVYPLRMYTTSPLPGPALPVRLIPDGSVVHVPALFQKPLLPPFTYV